MKIRNDRNRGFSVTEMLVVIGIFAVFALVATQLMHKTIRVSHDAGYAQIATTAFDAAGRAMRRDAWSAAEIKVHSEKSLTLLMPDGGTADWSVDDAGIFTRKAKGDERPQKWETKAAGATLAASGSAVVVRLPETKTSRGGELRFTSQLMLARRLTS